MKILGICLLACLAISVQAADIISLPNQEKLIDEPQGCLRALETFCSVRTSSREKFKLQLGQVEVVLDAATTVLIRSQDEVSLISGTIWVKAEKGFVVRSEFGQVKTAGGEFWVSRARGEGLWATAIKEDLQLAPRGLIQEIVLQEAEENWLGRVSKDGVAQTGTPRVLDFPEHINRWARLYPGPKDTFEQEVRTFKYTWKKVSEENAKLHQDLSNRRIATIDSEKRRQDEIRRAQEAENKYLRDLFRRKTLE